MASKFTSNYRELKILWDAETRAKCTPGRDIQRYAPSINGKPTGYVMLEGEKVQINAQAHTLSGYSAHADQKDLVNFVGRMRYKPKHIRIVHGDDGAKEALQKLYQQMLPECDVVFGC